jgi:hypothetical protein
MESKKFNIFQEDINKIYKKGINVFWNSIFVTLGFCFLGAINTCVVKHFLINAKDIPNTSQTTIKDHIFYILFEEMFNNPK